LSAFARKKAGLLLSESYPAWDAIDWKDGAEGLGLISVESALDCNVITFIRSSAIRAASIAFRDAKDSNQCGDGATYSGTFSCKENQ